VPLVQVAGGVQETGQQPQLAVGVPADHVGARSYFSLTAKIPPLRRKFLADLSTCRDDSADIA